MPIGPRCVKFFSKSGETGADWSLTSVEREKAEAADSHPCPETLAGAAVFLLEGAARDPVHLVSRFKTEKKTKKKGKKQVCYATERTSEGGGVRATTRL